MTTIDPLAELRAQIDALDAEILERLSARARLAQRVAAVKAADGDACYRPEREAQVLRSLVARNTGPLRAEHVSAIYREVMSACRALEQTLAIAYLGPAGTYTEAAALKHFGSSVTTVAAATIDDAFREVESGRCQFGVVPVENSIEGSVNQTLDRFVDSPLKACAEVTLPIHHHLLSKATSLEGIGTVYAHAQALAQCRRWLDRNLPRAQRVAAASNGEAARLAGTDAAAAAIAGLGAAEIYGLASLAANIEDDPSNTTRFLVIGGAIPGPSGADKTALVFATANEAGALHRALGVFAANGLSMVRIESRPSRRGNWEYLFFVDILGHVEDPAVTKAIGEFAAHTRMVKLLGSFPQAV
jgi:chorismate mutase/prephenate dehydratase